MTHQIAPPTFVWNLLTVGGVCACVRVSSRPLISYLSKFYYYDPEEEMYLSIKSIQRVVGAEQEAAESQT